MKWSSSSGSRLFCRLFWRKKNRKTRLIHTEQHEPLELVTSKKTVEIAQLWQHNRGNYTTPTIYQKKEGKTPQQTLNFFLNNLVWLKGGAIFCYFLLFWASGFFGAAEGGAILCCFLLFSAILGSSATPDNGFFRARYDDRNKLGSVLFFFFFFDHITILFFFPSLQCTPKLRSR